MAGPHAFILKCVQLPESLQIGCHQLTLATASETAEEMAFCSVVKACELALDTDSTLPPVETASELAMLLVSPFWAAFCSCTEQSIWSTPKHSPVCRVSIQNFRQARQHSDYTHMYIRRS